jgi:hypothetical protein
MGRTSPAKSQVLRKDRFSTPSAVSYDLVFWDDPTPSDNAEAAALRRRRSRRRNPAEPASAAPINACSSSSHTPSNCQHANNA